MVNKFFEYFDIDEVDKPAIIPEFKKSPVKIWEFSDVDKTVNVYYFDNDDLYIDIINIINGAKFLYKHVDKFYTVDSARIEALSIIHDYLNEGEFLNYLDNSKLFQKIIFSTTVPKDLFNIDN